MAFSERRNNEENNMYNVNVPEKSHLVCGTNQTTFVQPNEIINFDEPSQVIGGSTVSHADQDYWHYCARHSYNSVESSDVSDTTKTHKGWKYEKDKRHQKRMDTLLCNSCDMLREYFDPKLYPNNQIPYDLFQGCKGVIFLRIWKAGIFLGGIGGTGIILAHQNGKWSNPCAISIGGVQVGLHLGVERVDDILLLHDDSGLRLLFEKGHFKLGADASIAIGPYGRDANVGVAMSGKDSKSIYSYSFAKGAFIGFSLDGGSLTINDSVNEEYYGRKVAVKDILHSDINVPCRNDDFSHLLQLLDDYSLNRGQISDVHKTTNISTNPIVNQ